MTAVEPGRDRDIDREHVGEDHVGVVDADPAVAPHRLKTDLFDCQAFIE